MENQEGQEGQLDNTSPEPTNESEVDPILTNDLTGIAPEAPLIPANEYNFTVKKIETAKAQTSDNKMVNISLQSLEPIQAVNGEIQPAGSVMQFARIVITPTDKRTSEAIKRDLKRFQLACGVTSGPFYPLDQYVGKNLRAKVGFSKKTPDYPDERNEVKSFVVP